MFTKNINKMAFSASDNRRLKPPDGNISNPYRLGPGIVS